jgi:hypothetical protein
LRKRRRSPGRFTDGCDVARHHAALCEHFAGGFFAPGPATRDFSGAKLANGLVFGSDSDARLGLSALALHAVRRWSRCTMDDVAHLDALVRLANGAFRAGGMGSGIGSGSGTGNANTTGNGGGDTRVAGVPALLMVLSALTSAPRRPEFIMVLHGALTRLAGTQRADGSWPDADPFHVADVFLLAVHRGYGSPVFDAALVRTAEMLALMQQPDGSWGPIEPQRLLSGWRTLRHAARVVER